VKSCFYRKPRTTDLRPWLWGAAHTGRLEHTSPRLPRSDKQEETKCIFGPRVLTSTSYASCSIRIGAYARGVLRYGVNRQLTFSVLTNPGSTCRQFMPYQLSIVSGLVIFVGSGLIEGRIQDDLAQRLVFLYEPVSGDRLPERHHPVYAGTDFPAGGGFE